MKDYEPSLIKRKPCITHTNKRRQHVLNMQIRQQEWDEKLKNRFRVQYLDIAAHIKKQQQIEDWCKELD